MLADYPALKSLLTQQVAERDGKRRAWQNKIEKVRARRGWRTCFRSRSTPCTHSFSCMHCTCTGHELVGRREAARAPGSAGRRRVGLGVIGVHGLAGGKFSLAHASMLTPPWAGFQVKRREAATMEKAWQVRWGEESTQELQGV